jgi:DNA modification methylase
MPEKPENCLILGDCLEVMAHLPSSFIDLIYIDPPFGTGRAHLGEGLSTKRGGRIRTGEKTKVFRLSDVWEGHLDGYLEWLKPRLLEMARLLKPTGSLLVHLDWHASHYVKVMLDEIMGRRHFVNEIIWHYKTGGHARRRLSRKFDSIFWYAGSKEYTYNPEAASLPRNRCGLCGDIKKRKNHMKRKKDEKGRVVCSIKSGGRTYQYYEDDPAPPSDVWLDIPHLQQRDPERTGYPAQKPLKLLKRLVLLCSRPGDVVADFYAGTGTTLIAASQLGRKWLGCDTEAEALRLAAQRMERLGLSCSQRTLGAD